MNPLNPVRPSDQRSIPLLLAEPSSNAAVSSGPSPTALPLASPTLHLIGAGKVGRAFLRLLADLPLRLIAVSDTSATLFAREGLDARALADWKETRPFAAHPRAAGIPLEIALSVTAADLVVDCTDSNLAPAARAESTRRIHSLLQSGRRVVLAAKTPLLGDSSLLLAPDSRRRLGINAVLGGTGRSLLRELDELRARWVSLACVPNSTTTAIVSALERGLSFEEGVTWARALGLLERDPAQDLDGRDAAVKLAVVAAALFGRAVEAEEVHLPDPGALDPELLRRRREQGATTRLVGRANRAGELTLAWEEVAIGSALAVQSSRVVYAYSLQGGATRVHLGDGLGPERTARALLEDVVSLAGLDRSLACRSDGRSGILTWRAA